MATKCLASTYTCFWMDDPNILPKGCMGEGTVITFLTYSFILKSYMRHLPL
jgi:hypothetical protein